MSDRRLSLRLAGLYERFRGSLFYVPAAYIVLAAVGAFVTSRFDREFARDLPDIPILLPTTVESARSILSTIAGATITVAGVMFSLTVIAVQLASSQFSPRVLRGLLRDRFSQHTIGITVAVFTYCLLVLAGTRQAGGSEQPFQNVSVTIAVAVSIVAVLAIVAFLDHSARSMQVGEVIRNVAEETHSALRDRYPEPAEDDDEPEIPDDPDRPPDVVVRVVDEGWVQLIDATAVLETLPPGAQAHIRARPGAYLLRGEALIDVWGEVDDDRGLAKELRSAIALGGERTMQQDVAFGIRQLVDIGLRALSPGINDPTTAIEVLFRLGGITRELALRELPPRVLHGDEGRTVLRGDLLEFDDLVRYAFRQIREVAVSQPGVIKVLMRVLGQVADELRRHGLEGRVEPLHREARLALEALEAHGHIGEDVAPIRAAAEQYGLA
ncbi:MAG: DUF2254 domain-containing protein [Nitriliruptorales bacterium]|nr:DUF2254 domain-containing protein [Nitriliruptorales bacterium]